MVDLRLTMLLLFVRKLAIQKCFAVGRYRTVIDTQEKPQGAATISEGRVQY